MTELPLITSEDFGALEPEWAALHARVPDATPFLHPRWHRVWLKNFGQQSAPVFLAVRRGEDLVGVATLDMDRDLACELGDPNVRDYAGPLAMPGEEAAVAAGILEWLREDFTPNAEFWGLAVDVPVLSALREAADASGWAAEQQPETVCPGINLPGDFDSFLATLSKKDRHELRRKIRNFEEAGTYTFTTATEPDEIVARMPELFRLMKASREGKEEFLTPSMETFFRDIGQSFGDLGMLRLSTLALAERTVAMVLCFEDETTAYLYNSGFEPEFVSLSVGLVSKAFAIREAIERRKARFDFLRGVEDYKHRLGGVDREVARLLLRT